MFYAFNVVVGWVICVSCPFLVLLSLYKKKNLLFVAIMHMVVKFWQQRPEENPDGFFTTFSLTVFPQ